MRILAKLFKWGAIATVIVVLTGIGWAAYEEVQISEAAQLDESMTMMRHQTAGMSTALVEASNFVEEVKIAKVTSINILLTLWEPHYSASQAAYTRLDASIVLAEQQATAYFTAKRALSERYHDPERQALAEQRDAEEFALYEAWQGRAHRARDDAAAIIRRFDDMHTDLRRLELTSDFTFDAGLFDTVPTEISDLNDKLADFQIASENIQAITKSPFEVE